MRGLLKSFAYAIDGFLYAVRSQRNMRIHVFVAVCALLAGLLLQLHALEWGIIILCIGLVLSAECMNTALEALVDLVSPERHELAKRAKDCAAAAVLVLAVMAVVVGLIVYVCAYLRLVA